MNRTTSREGYTDDFVRRREQEQAQREAETAQRKRDNDATRREYLAGLEAQREAKRQEAWAEVEAQLEPTKARLKREWLAAHPHEDAATFEQRAWPQLKQNVLEDMEAERLEAAKASLRASGEYRL